MIFGRDMIINTPFIVDLGSISLRKQKLIDKQNQIENKNRKPHTYIIWNKVSVRKKKQISMRSNT